MGGARRRGGGMPQLVMAQSYLARGVKYLTEDREPVRDDVRARLPVLIAEARAVVVKLGRLIELQQHGTKGDLDA